MKINHWRLLTGILEVVWSIPIIGMILIGGSVPVLPLVMIGLHAATIYSAFKEKEKWIGNVLGIIASIFAILIILDGSFNQMGPNAGLKWFPLLLASWPFHIASFIIIFSDMANRTRQSKIIKYNRNQGFRHNGWEGEVHSEEQTQSERVFNRLCQYSRGHSSIGVDTNILMNEDMANLLYAVARKENIPVSVSRIVLQELDGLKNCNERGKAARQGSRMLEKFGNSGYLHLVHMPDQRTREKYGLSTAIKDEGVIGSYLMEMERTERSILFMTNDRNLRILAGGLGLATFDYSSC